MYFINPKTKKRRSTLGIIGYVALFVFIFASCALAFAGIGMAFSPFLETDKDWLYFAVTGIPAIFASSFIDMFVAKSYIFNAKDNDLLLSMPIKPGHILLSRMLGLYLYGLLYYSITFIPPIIVYYVIKGFSIYPIFVFIVSSILVVGLSTIFGYVVALISSRMRNKTITTVLLTLLLLGVYYVCYFRMEDLLTSIVTNASQTESFIRGPFILFYFMGKACVGDIVSTLIFTAISICVFSLMYYAVSKKFISIVTRNVGEAKKEYKEKTAKENSMGSLLVKKELRHFLSSVSLMLNVGLGILILPAIGIGLIVKSNDILPLLELLKSELPMFYDLVPIGVVAVGILVISLGVYTASSISLEGKNLWIIKSTPVDTKEFLFAKIKTQMILYTLPDLAYALLACTAMKLPLDNSIIICLLLILYNYFLANFGLWLNIKHPNFDWTNENIPVKQGLPVAITLFGGWGIAIAFCLVSYFLIKLTDVYTIIIGFLIIIALATRLISKLIFTKGIEIVNNY